jgi:hypothetical protein
MRVDGEVNLGNVLADGFAKTRKHMRCTPGLRTSSMVSGSGDGSSSSLGAGTKKLGVEQLGESARCFWNRTSHWSRCSLSSPNAFGRLSKSSVVVLATQFSFIEWCGGDSSIVLQRWFGLVACDHLQSGRNRVSALASPTLLVEQPRCRIIRESGRLATDGRTLADVVSSVVSEPRRACARREPRQRTAHSGRVQRKAFILGLLSLGRELVLSVILKRDGETTGASPFVDRERGGHSAESHAPRQRASLQPSARGRF